MNVISPCTTWIPILWGQLRGLFIKTRAVGNPAHDLRAVDDPLTDLPTVDNHVHDLQAIDSSVPYLAAVNGALPDLQVDCDPHPDLPAVADPAFPHQPVGNYPFSNTQPVNVPLPPVDPLTVNISLPLVDDLITELPQVNNPNPHVEAVDETLPDLSAVDKPFSILQAVDDPLSNMLVLDNTLPHLEVVDEPLHKLPGKDNPLSHIPSTDDDLLPDIPYHIMTDILSRLPAKCVFQCQSVSRLLHVLTTTPFFIRTHLNQATSVVALQSLTQSSDRDIKLYFIEDKAEKIEEATLKIDFCYMRKEDPIMLFGSCDGFLLFSNRSRWYPFFFMWNPITNERVTVTSPCSDLYVCGFYFHPLKREYEVLFSYKKGTRFEFQILSLGTKSWRNIGYCLHPPSRLRPPTIINGTLHWMVDVILYYDVYDIDPSCFSSIVSFNIETEEFSTMNHGGPFCRSGYTHRYMQLLEMEGQLGLCYAYSSTELGLWVLNYATKCWDKRHTMTLLRYDMTRYFSIWPNELDVEVVQIKNDELLLRHMNRLLAYNLHLGTSKVVVKKGFEDDNFRSIIHTHSLVSLDTDKAISLKTFCK